MANKSKFFKSISVGPQSILSLGWSVEIEISPQDELKISTKPFLGGCSVVFDGHISDVKKIDLVLRCGSSGEEGVYYTAKLHFANGSSYDLPLPNGIELEQSVFKQLCERLGLPSEIDPIEGGLANWESLTSAKAPG